MGKMTEKDLNAILDAHIANSLGREGSKLADERRNALAYYYGEAKGDLAPPGIDGRSSVVSTDVADTIEWIMPTLMRIFTSGDSAVEFMAQGMEDEPFAKQATDYVNYLFYRRNPGFLILHTWFKDALLQKLGVVHTYYESKTEDTRQEYRGLTEDELAFLLQTNDGLTVIERSPNADDPALIDVACKLSKPVQRICVANIPPEDFIVSRHASSLNTADGEGHRVQRSLSDLRAAGYPKNKVDELADDTEAGWSLEAKERATHDDDQGACGSDDAPQADESQRKIWLYEMYIRCDFDGDGIAEWRQVKRAGRTILSNVKVDDHPYSALTPILMSHRLVGRSIADLVMDLQRIKTALMRQTLDNMYLVNNGRFYVDTTKQVNLDDLLNSRPGGIVRGKGPDGVSSLAPPMLGGGAFSLIEYIDTVKENRTGVTRYNQGLDANSLNKTATGVTQIMGAAQQRIELIARVMAETGVVDMFKKLLKLVTTQMNKKAIIRLTNGYVEVDPSQWKNQFDITVNVGLGTGNKDQQASHLTNLLQIQQGLVGAGIVTPKNIYETARRLPEALGFKADAFFTDPDQAQQEQPQGPDPEMAKMQAEQQALAAKQQADEARAQRDHEFRMAQAANERRKIELDAELRMMELQQKKEQAEEDRELKWVELAANTSLPAVVQEPQVIEPPEEEYPLLEGSVGDVDMPHHEAPPMVSDDFQPPQSPSIDEGLNDE